MARDDKVKHFVLEWELGGRCLDVNGGGEGHVESDESRERGPAATQVQLSHHVDTSSYTWIHCLALLSGENSRALSSPLAESPAAYRLS